MASEIQEVPVGNAAGLKKYLKQDLLSGFLVFLIALPLCLGIALAYGYPPIAGVFTAIIGGIVTTFISNSELTIKGPAAGLIAIAAPCLQSFGWDGAVFNSDAYQAALAVGIAAGVIQILMGVFRVGSLGEFFPSSVVHGMLAAIGVIILLKMFPQAIGVKVQNGEPLALLLAIPKIIPLYDPTIAVVGLVSIAIMFLWPLVKYKPLKAIPAAMIVVIVAIPLANALQIGNLHTNRLDLKEETEGKTAAAKTDKATKAETEKPATVASDTLIQVPKFGETFDAFASPRYEVLYQPIGPVGKETWLGFLPQAWKWVVMFAIIGTLESMLSAKAMDLIDPWKRKTNLDRDNIAVGSGNVLCALVGAAPMISEIVRSRANMDNGARTRFADLFHALFLLSFVCLLPFVVAMIPVAALMAMLVYTGYRLAHPKEFVHVFKIGPEQLIVYCATMIGCFAIDLLAGVAIGIGVKILIHIANGAPLESLFKPKVETVEAGDGTLGVRVRESAIFTNWLPIRKRIVNLGLSQGKNVLVDLSETRLVDHTVMENLHGLQRDFAREGLTLDVTGFDTLRPIGNHEHSARKHGLLPMRKVMIIADESLEERIERECIDCGASGFTVVPCRGAGRRDLNNGEFHAHSQVCIEVIVPGEVCNDILAFLRNDILQDYHVTAFVETVEALRPDQFAASGNGRAEASHEQELVGAAANDGH